MTKKRDLKRRVRERQARTGESYVTARRQLLAARSIAPPVPVPVPVVELHDVSAEAARLGFQCQIAVFPELRAVAEPGLVLVGLREALIAAPGDLAAARMFDLAFAVRSAGVFEPRVPPSQQRLYERLRMERGGPSEPSSVFAFRVAGLGGSVPVLCVLAGPRLLLTAIHDRMAAELASLAPPVSEPGAAVDAAARAVMFYPGDAVRILEGPFVRLTGTVAAVEAGAHRLSISLVLLGRVISIELDFAQVARSQQRLFLLFDDREHPIVTQRFVIGRDPRYCDLAIRDGMVSRQHAEVVARNGAHYVKDLGSAHGIEYKGMRIDHKRIEDGDVFRIAEYELRFELRVDG
jgi:hypothetical protein